MLSKDDELFLKQVRCQIWILRTENFGTASKTSPRGPLEPSSPIGYLPNAGRTLIEAYRQHVGNPDAAKPSDTWSRWSSEFAWRERAAAYDAHIDRLREKSMEKAVQREAEERARQVERISGRFNELMTIAYEKVIDYLESDDFLQQMRPQDAINILKLHLEVTQKLGDTNTQAPDSGVDWSEDEQRELDRIVGEIESEEAQEEPSSASGVQGPGLFRGYY